MDEIKAVFFSVFGTTRTIAMALSNELAAKVFSYDLLSNPQQDAVICDKDTPVIFAVPVFAGRVPEPCAEMIRCFKGDKTPAIVVVSYGNRDFDDALIELRDLVSQSGFIVVSAAAFVTQHSIFPKVGAGRPDKRDMALVGEFASRCKTALIAFTGAKKIEVKGSEDYRSPAVVPLYPSGDTKCNSCGTCVAICPVQAIRDDQPRKTNKKKCISCTACIAVCPQEARAFRGPLYSVASMGFQKLFAKRKEPEFFFAE